MDFKHSLLYIELGEMNVVSVEQSIRGNKTENINNASVSFVPANTNTDCFIVIWDVQICLLNVYYTSSGEKEISVFSVH